MDDDGFERRGGDKVAKKSGGETGRFVSVSIVSSHALRINLFMHCPAKVADLESLEANLDARASVAGAALMAVQQANEHERNQFRTQAAAQREQLNASSAWELRKVRAC